MQEIVSVVKNVTMFLLVASLLINLFSDSEYKKYIRYVVGLIVMVMVISPVLRVIQGGVKIRVPEQDMSVEEQVRQQEEKMKRVEEQYEEEILSQGGKEHGEWAGE